jgi:hypothetical protein
MDRMKMYTEQLKAGDEDQRAVNEAEVYKRPAKVSALGGQKFHAIVDSKGMIVAAGMSEKEAKKKVGFNQKVRELPGAKVGQKLAEDVEHVNEEYRGVVTLEIDKELRDLYRHLQEYMEEYVEDILYELRDLNTHVETLVEEVYEEVNTDFDRKIDRFGASMVADQLAGGLGARNPDSVFDSLNDLYEGFEDIMNERVKEILRNPPRSQREVLKALERIPTRYIEIAQEAKI